MPTLTRRLTMAQALIAFLEQQYVERDGQEHRFFAGVWGIFGHGNVAGLGQALHQSPDFRYYLCRNEQAMVHTAAAFAKMSNRLRTFACTSSIGPGATNLITGAATATINRLPVLLLPGDIFARRNVSPVLQQLESERSQEKYAVDTAYMFLGFVNNNQRLYSRLQKSGFVLIFKPVVTDANGNIKGNVDADLVLQVMMDLEEFDKAVIVTSDGDFYSLVRHLYALDKLEVVLSPSVHCSKLLRKESKEKIIYMDNLKARLEFIVANEKSTAAGRNLQKCSLVVIRDAIYTKQSGRSNSSSNYDNSKWSARCGSTASREIT
ncbi:MAG: thiamine pyrophosphate-binding protein [Blastocatellia bacterium]